MIGSGASNASVLVAMATESATAEKVVSWSTRQLRVRLLGLAMAIELEPLVPQPWSLAFHETQRGSTGQRYEMLGRVPSQTRLIVTLRSEAYLHTAFTLPLRPSEGHMATRGSTSSSRLLLFTGMLRVIGSVTLSIDNWVE